MRQFVFEKTELEGLMLIKPFVAEDARGSFIKDYALELFQSNGIQNELKEVFYTHSHKGVIRAIHFQEVMQQAKLVRCIQGKIFDIAVDLRPASPTFGKHLSFILDSKNCHSLYIPKHFGHGYLVLQESIVSYKCDEKFYGEHDTGIIWNDPEIGIKWPLEQVGEVILSEKDKSLQSFRQFREENQCN